MVTNIEQIDINSEILIVGAGPVGLSLAILLRQYDVPIRIIEQNSGPSTATKAMAIHSRTLEIFRELGIVNEVMNQGFPVKKYSVQSDKKRILNYDFSLLEAAWPMILSIPQPEVEKLMLERLEGLGVAVEWNTCLIDIRKEDQRVDALLQKNDGGTKNQEWLSYRWLCACDGARSTVRKQLKLDFSGASYDSYFMLTDANISWDYPCDEGAFFLGSADGYVGVAPLDGKGRYRLFFEMPYTLPPEEQRPKLDLSTFQKLCDGRGKVMTLSNLSSMTIASFQHRQVNQLKHGSIFLVGDAAHIGSPIGGQWMNLGLSEAYNLGWKLAWVYKGYANSELLDSYHDERFPVAQEAEKTAHRLTKLITTKNPVVVYLRNNLLPFITNRKKIQKKLPLMISGHNYNYCKSDWISNKLSSCDYKSWRKKFKKSYPRYSAPKAGQLAPDINLWTPFDNKNQRLSSLYHQNFLLMIFTEADAGSVLVDSYLSMAKAIVSNFKGIQSRCVIDSVEINNVDSSENIIADPDWRLHHRYCATRGNLVLIRPDGYIAFQGKDPDELISFIKNKLSFLVNETNSIGGTYFNNISVK